MIVDKVSDLIGNTPVLRIRAKNPNAKIFLKLEMFNPCGSMKDRMAKKMFAELLGKHVGKVKRIVESSSGNTATALAMLAAERGVEFTAIVDGHAAKSKLLAIEAMGASLNRISSDDPNKLATAQREDTAKELARSEDGTFCTLQNNNQANPDGYIPLAEELKRDIGKIDYLFASIGTGGSISGTSRHLKKSLPDLKAIAIEPEGSHIFGGKSHDYHQSGTGSPKGGEIGLATDYDVLDEGRKVDDVSAFTMCRIIAEKVGLMIGGSAGGVVYEILRFADHLEEEATIVGIVADSGFKYLDTYFDDDWLKKHDLHSVSKRLEILNYL